jgi:hypothetical protein
MAVTGSIKHVDRSAAIAIVARVGYATEGVLYLLVGGLATAYAFGAGGKITNGEGAASTLEAQPFGQALLWATAIGLFAYAAWRLLQAFVDPEHRATGGRDVGRRIGYALSGAAHAALGVAVVQMATGGSSGGDEAKRTYLAKLMELPGGTAIFFLTGLAVIGFGIYQMVAAYRASFMDELKSNEMSAAERAWSLRVGRIGLAARGVVSCIIGYFLCRAGDSGSSSQVKDIGGALRAIASESDGMILLAIVALGLVAYALHQFFKAKYRRIEAHV